MNCPEGAFSVKQNGQITRCNSDSTNVNERWTLDAACKSVLLSNSQRETYYTFKSTGWTAAPSKWTSVTSYRSQNTLHSIFIQLVGGACGQLFRLKSSHSVMLICCWFYCTFLHLTCRFHLDRLSVWQPSAFMLSNTTLCAARLTKLGLQCDPQTFWFVEFSLRQPQLWMPMP